MGNSGEIRPIPTPKAGMARNQQQAWDDWGKIDPLFAILTDHQRQNNKWDVDEFFALGANFIQLLMEKGERLGRPVHRHRALDFGCGVGRLTRDLGTRFDDALGLDIAPSMIERARQLNTGQPNCRFQLHQGTDLRAIPDASIDLVVCVLVLQHLPTPGEIETYVTEFVRVLAPGGMAVIQIPSKVAAPLPPPSLRTKVGRRMRLAALLRRTGVPAALIYSHFPWNPGMTMTGLTPERVAQLVEAAGASVLEMVGPDIDSGGTEGWIHYVGPPMTA